MTDTPEPMFLLLKRGYYWRPNAQGYTSSISEAGRYTEAEARAYCRNPDVTMIPASAMTDTQLKPELVVDGEGWVRVRIDTLAGEDGWCFCTPPTHPDDIASRGEWEGTSQFFGKVETALYTQDQLDAAVRAERERARHGTRIYIDCEFNGWMGELISFAMVADDGREFYSVLPEPREWDTWCFENVKPILGKPPVSSYADFRLAFIEFLRGYRNPIIVADWPADLYYFNKVLLGRTHEESTLIPCRFELIGCDIAPETPHNALSDARAIAAAIREGE